MRIKVKPSARTHTPPASYHRTKPDPSRPPSGHWYAVVCNINAEKKAQRGLQAAFMTYLPVTVRKQKCGGRRALEAIVERPLFPRYLFVASREPAFRFFDLSRVNGVESIVRCDGVPMPIPHAVIGSLMARDLVGEFVGPGIEADLTLEDVGLSTGANAVIKRGLSEGFECVIKALMPKAHASVMIRMFGREVEVQVPLADLEAVA